MIDDPIKLQLPDIRLLCCIGEGGMSQVWKAIDLVRDRLVAVKILNTQFTADRDDLERFKAEERAMETISHPGIVKGYELRHTGSLWYYIMEYVDGYNFGQLLRRKQHLCEADCLLICQSVALALDYAWNSHGIVHCDLKPENIMINRDGIVKLTDLGVCHTFAYMADGRQDVPDHVLGTPAYISPEQVFGDVELDCRSDIYSLAATLYHLATGRYLFPGRDAEAMMRAHCGDDQGRDPRAYRTGLSEGFCQMLEGMLVKNRDERIASWADVCEISREVERGVAFKPREGGRSSLALE